MSTTENNGQSSELVEQFRRINTLGAAERLQLAREQAAKTEATNPQLAALMREVIAQEEKALNTPPSKPEPPKVMSGTVPLLPTPSKPSSSSPVPTTPSGGVDHLRHLLLLHEGMTSLHAQHAELQRSHMQTVTELSAVRTALAQMHNHNLTTGRLVAELHAALHGTPNV